MIIEIVFCPGFGPFNDILDCIIHVGIELQVILLILHHASTDQQHKNSIRAIWFELLQKSIDKHNSAK